MTKSQLFQDLNQKLATGSIYPSDYHQAIEQLHNIEMRDEPEPIKKFVLTFNEADGLRIEKPCAPSCMVLTIARWVAVAGLAVALMLK